MAYVGSFNRDAPPRGREFRALFLQTRPWTSINQEEPVSAAIVANINAEATLLSDLHESAYQRAPIYLGIAATAIAHLNCGWLRFHDLGTIL